MSVLVQVQNGLNPQEPREVLYLADRDTLRRVSGEQVGDLGDFGRTGGGQ